MDSNHRPSGYEPDELPLLYPISALLQSRTTGFLVCRATIKNAYVYNERMYGIEGPYGLYYLFFLKGLVTQFQKRLYQGVFTVTTTGLQ